MPFSIVADNTHERVLRLIRCRSSGELEKRGNHWLDCGTPRGPRLAAPRAIPGGIARNACAT